ncbi:MAG: ABC transporter permease [Solirubrobacteraceae bacterium]
MTLLQQVRWIAQRSVLRTIRQPAQIVPSLIFPLFLLAVNSAGLDAATKLPGFPTSSYLNFALAVCFLQAALFAVSIAGTDLADDIQTGFLNRLSLTPMRRAALLLGHLAGVMVLGAIQACLYILVGVTAGADIEAGVGGCLVLVVLSVLTCTGFGAIGVLAALRMGSSEAVQGLFPVMFVLLFLSSMSLPRDLIANDWFRTVATWNPVSYLVEGVRSLIITGWDGEALALGFLVSIVVLVLGIAGASASMRTRMVRT